MTDAQALSVVARALAEPGRVELLALLAQGSGSVSELAVRLGRAQPRVSTQLAALRAAGLVTVSRVGRHRRYGVDGRRIHQAITSLRRLLSPGRPAPADGRPRVARAGDLRTARTCYDHLAGVAGVALLTAMVHRGWMAAPAPGRRDIAVTPKGEQALTARGIDFDGVRRARRAFATPCLDWTERQPHLGGALGAGVFEALRAGGFVRHKRGTRALEVRRPVEEWLRTPTSTRS